MKIETFSLFKVESQGNHFHVDISPLDKPLLTARVQPWPMFRVIGRTLS